MRYTIPEIKEKSKLIVTSNDFFIGAIIILVGVTSFGLGKISANSTNKPAVRIEYENTQYSKSEAPTGQDSTILPLGEGNTASATAVIPGGVVVSKNGTAYHLPWCSGASRIKDENKVWYATKEEAEAAGYRPAKNCKGI